MRIDKYLKISRIIKRRTVAKEACEGGKILINGKIAKPGDNVKIEDKITISLGNNTIVVKVKSISSHSTKESANKLYELYTE